MEMTIASVGDAFAISSKKFDPDTREQLKTEVVGIGLEDIEKQRDALLKQLAQLDAVIADMKALKEASKGK